MALFIEASDGVHPSGQFGIINAYAYHFANSIVFLTMEIKSIPN